MLALVRLGRRRAAVGVVVAAMVAVSLAGSLTGPVPSASAAGCAVATPSAARQGASIDALRGPSWTAADLTGSIDLTDGRRLWLYGDTITSGLAPGGGVASAEFSARSSAIVQDRGCFSVLIGPPEPSGPGGLAVPTSWIPPVGAEWNWPADGYARAGTVWIYATRLRSIGPGVFGFEARAVDLVEVDQATMKIRRVHRGRYGASPVLLGSSVTTDGTWAYIYGRDERGTKRHTYLARVPAANPLGTTTYWTGSTWSPSAAAARPIFTTDVVGGPAIHDLGPAYGERRFVAAVKDGEFLASSVELYTAPGPAGPWWKLASVPAPGLAGDASTWTYLAALHGVDATGGLHLTWNVNSFDAAAVQRDVHAYGEVHRAVPVRLRAPPPGAPAVPAAVPMGAAGGLVPLGPVRAVDTRSGLGGVRRLEAGRAVALPLGATPGVPVGAGSVVATFTVVDPAAAGFLTVWPCGRPLPVASSLNYLRGEVVPNTVTASLGSGGTVCVYPQQDLDLVVDVAGTVGPVGHGFAGVAPTRLVDTRIGQGGARMPPGGQLAVRVGGRAGVPAGAVAASLNVTATQASWDGFVTAWPCDRPRPVASVVNIAPGLTRANNVVVPLSSAGEVCLHAHSPMDVIVDVSGYYGAGAGGAHQAVVPVRRLDTRSGQGGYGRPGSGQILTLPVAGRDGIPAWAKAVRVNLVAVAPSATTYVSAYPCGRWPPTVSNLNLEPAGAFRANGATVPLDAGGRLCLYTHVATDLVVDIEGWVT